MADRYWVGGTGTWDNLSTANWSASSGGASGASFPTLTDNVFFDANSNIGTGAFTVTLGATVSCLNFNTTGLDGAMTLSRSGSINLDVYGSFTITSNFSFASSSFGVRFRATSGSHAITTNGVSISCPISFEGVGGTWQLQDPLTIASDRSLGLFAGTLDLNGQTITTGAFGAGGSSVRTLAFASGKIVLTGFGGLWAANPTTNMSFTGTPVVDVTYAGASACSISWVATESLAVSFNIKAGTYALTISNSAVKSLDCTGFAGTLLTSGAVNIFGSLTLSSGMAVGPSTSAAVFASTSGTNTITTNGRTMDLPVTFNGVGGTWQLQDAMTLGSTRSVILTNGTLDLNGQTLTALSFDSNVPTARTIAFGLGKIVLSGNATVWSTSTITNLTITGTPVVDLTYALAVAVTVSPGALPESSSISFNVKAGTYALTLTGNVKTIDFTGFAGSLVNSVRTIFGNLLVSSGMTVSAGANATTFAATSGIKTITTNGKLVDFPVTFNGVGGTWQLQDALTLGATRTATLTNGTLDLNTKTLTTGTFSSSNTNIRVLTMTGASVVVLGSGTAAWTMATSTNATINGSGSTISMNSASAKTFSGGGRTYGTLTQGGAGVLTVAGSNTFADISNTVQPATVRLTAGTTQTVSAFSLSGTSGNLITLDTTAAGTRATLSDASGTVSVSFVSIKDINATGGATWNSLTVNGNVDAGNNLGWNFVAVVARMIFRQVFRPVFSEIFRPIF